MTPETDNRHAKKQITFTGKLLDYSNYRSHSSLFIETGTAAGDGVQRALDAGFAVVESCEGAQKWFNLSSERFRNNGNVIIKKATSSEFLTQQVQEFYFPAVIFLDAHPAGPESYGHKEWEANPNGEANQHNIICSELAIVLAHRNDHVIIIDDVNGLADGCAEEYMRMCLLANPAYRFEFWDEDLSGNHRYINKILVCLP